MGVQNNFRPISPIHNHIESLREGFTPNSFWRQFGIAFLWTLLFYYTIGYVNTGKILLPWIYFEKLYVEFLLAFTYVITLLLIFRRLNRVFRRPGRTLKGSIGVGVEIVVVLAVALLLFVITNYIPLRLIYPDLEFAPVRLRTAFAFSAINALFLNYFVVGHDYERKLAAQKLKTSQLAQENYRAELATLKQQVDPHFLFNSLNVLGSLIQTNPEKATRFNENLAEVYRAFLAHSKEDLIPLSKEMEVVEAYAFLMKTRLGEGLRFMITSGHPYGEYMVPPGSVQTLVENAIKHNQAHPDDPLKVKIAVRSGALRITNNLNPREGVLETSMIGLSNLNARVRIIAGKSLDIMKTPTEFTVQVPLISRYVESSNR